MKKKTFSLSKTIVVTLSRSLIWFIASFALIACTNTSKTSDNYAFASTINSALIFAEKQSLLMAEKYKDQEGKLPQTYANGNDVSSDSRWWCSGFFPGSLWYIYENSLNPDVLKYAQLYTDRIEREKYTTDNHDVGFMIYCSFGNGYRLTKNRHYEEVMLTAAKSLSTRYRPKVGLIRSWDHNTEQWQYPVIIDNIMNLELLLWAAEYSGDTSFKAIALSHADKTMQHHFRPDYSSYHVVSYDTITGIPHLRQTHQGFSDESSWSRGQAWGLYGYTYLYRETKNERYLQQAVEIANYLINHPNMPEDYIPYWDYNSPDIPDTYRDVSAAAIMASALVELSEYAEKDRAQKYRQVVETQIKTLASSTYTANLGENGCFILKHSVGAYPLKSEVDVPLTYADYYYLEALTRLKKRI
ncbi:glucuronyl hydrolase [Sphingobacterium alkalisoli]|uniref:Glucuronyl hydrolase n=1 Tax=Sphingobacterium alkalisoli TaxID=1874115 RepID=A0A4U0H943_9SPHI|nr:glycoside hydrolase family 88 protein [Sphingobacterium alkalisoli]TJY68405.1 glucuronyl hydrolase [Sphingobacterium alkalisoli]